MIVNITIPSGWEKALRQIRQAIQFHIFYRPSISGFWPMIEVADFLFLSVTVPLLKSRFFSFCFRYETLADEVYSML